MKTRRQRQAIFLVIYSAGMNYVFHPTFVGGTTLWKTFPRLGWQFRFPVPTPVFGWLGARRQSLFGQMRGNFPSTCMADSSYSASQLKE